MPQIRRELSNLAARQRLQSARCTSPGGHPCTVDAIATDPLVNFIRAVNLQPMRLREAQVRQDVGLGLVHQRADLREALSELIGDRTPLSPRLGFALLGEDGADERGDHLALALGDVDEHVSHEVHPAALPGRLQHLRNGRLQPLVVVGDDELHPAQAATRQRAQEVRPEGLGLRGPDRHPEDLALALGAHRDGDYHGDRNDPPGLARLHVGRVDPQIRPVALDRAIQERPDPLVDLGAQPRDLALARSRSCPSP